MQSGERLGLVGRNGSGKTTLFKIILGEEEPDEGQIVFPKNYRLGYLEQHIRFTKPTLLEEACLGLSPEEKEAQYKVKAVLFGLGFTEADLIRPPEQFSGGFQIRLHLAKVLVSEASLLLLDEPTNYLDIISVRWLTEFLRKWPGELILVSHDRDFLDAVTTHTAAIHRHQIKRVHGTTKKLYDQILLEEEIHESTRINDEKKRKHMETFINRFRAKATKASVVQSRVKLLEKLPVIDQLSQEQTLDYTFRAAPFEAKTLLEVQDLTFGFPSGPTLIQDLNFFIGKNDRLAVIGKNGKGKSTLLRLLSGELKPQKGLVKKQVHTQLGYFGQTHIADLTPTFTVEEEINAVNPSLSRTEVRGICGAMMFSGDQAEKKISVLSGGEKSRVLLGKILAKPSNLLFLDEPTHHLDMEAIQSLMESLEEYPGAVLIVTHSEMILREVATKLIIFHRDRVEFFNGTYDDFLEKIGWEEEAKNKKSQKEKGPSGYEIQKQAQRDLVEQKKKLRPIKRQIEETEKKIMELEALLQQHHAGLVKASEETNAEKIRELSQALTRLEAEIDVQFDKLSDLNEAYVQLL